MSAVRSISVEARRWFQRTYGNTYHTVRVVALDDEGRQLVDLTSPVTYGYGEHYLHTAGVLMRRSGLLDIDPYEFVPHLLRREHGIITAVVVADVPRKRDLHRRVRT